MSFWARIFGSRNKAAEGEYMPGPYQLDSGWLSASAGRAMNWWQMGASLGPNSTRSAMVEACVSAYAQTAAMCPGGHWRLNPETGGRELVESSALARIIRRPNGYQSMSDFLLNAVRQLYQEGEFFALALRNDRFEISELHLMRTRGCAARVAEDGSIFYDLGGNEIIERRMSAIGASSLIVPARDVLHCRLHTPRHPLKGESPIMAAALDVAAQDVLLERQVAFFTNRSRPSFVLSTDEKLTAAQADELRTAWNNQSQGLNEGKTPILSWGIKPLPIGHTAADAQLSETMRMTEEHIALAFRVPMQVLGQAKGATYSSTEALMQSWIASGLGFCLNHVEEAFGLLFGLRGMPNEYLEFDTGALLRSSFKDRMEGLSRAVTSGIYSPDEARGKEELPRVPGGYGQMPRVQQQDVPLDWHERQEQQVPVEALPETEGDSNDQERHDPDIIYRKLDDLSRLH